MSAERCRSCACCNAGGDRKSAQQAPGKNGCAWPSNPALGRASISPIALSCAARTCARRATLEEITSWVGRATLKRVDYLGSGCSAGAGLRQSRRKNGQQRAREVSSQAVGDLHSLRGRFERFHLRLFPPLPVNSILHFRCRRLAASPPHCRTRFALSPPVCAAHRSSSHTLCSHVQSADNHHTIATLQRPNGGVTSAPVSSPPAPAPCLPACAQPPRRASLLASLAPLLRVLQVCFR